MKGVSDEVVIADRAKSLWLDIELEISAEKHNERSFRDFLRKTAKESFYIDEDLRSSYKALYILDKYAEWSMALRSVDGQDKGQPAVVVGYITKDNKTAYIAITLEGLVKNVSMPRMDGFVEIKLP